MEREIVKGEIHALVFAIAELLGNLSALLADQVPGWDVANGFDYEIIDRRKSSHDVIVGIHPVGWSRLTEISCRFLPSPVRVIRGGGTSGGWNPYKGMITSPYPEFRKLAFKVDPGDRPDRIKPMDIGSPEAEIMTRALERRGLIPRAVVS